MKKNYIFTKKSHSNKAIFSTILGVISLLSEIIVVYMSYRNAHVTESQFGVAGLLISIYSLVGLIMAVYTTTEKERYKLFIVLGIVFNTLALFGMGIIMYTGVYYIW